MPAERSLCGFRGGRDHRALRPGGGPRLGGGLRLGDLKTLCLLAVPTKPLNVTVLGVTSGSIRLGWAEPERVNGAIEGYYIYYIHANYTDVATYRLQGNLPKLQYNLKNLSKCPAFITPHDSRLKAPVNPQLACRTTATSTNLSFKTQLQPGKQINTNFN